jgi:nicotinamidase-related amidase
MQALLVVDAQNEFSAQGQRAVPDHSFALAAIVARVEEARAEQRPIAWIRHFNRPHESPAFRPGTWGAELSPGLGVRAGSGPEREFTKDVYGAFSAPGFPEWLKALGVTEVMVVGFYSHMCVSTTVREALVRDYPVSVDPEATGARDLDHPVLGRQSADEVRRTALLQVENMGAVMAPSRLARAVV